MTMGIGPLLPPTGGGPGGTSPAEEVRNQDAGRAARATGQTAEAPSANADERVAKPETVQAVQPTPAAAKAVKVDLDADRVVDGVVEYPVTGPDLFVQAATEQAIQVADAARETAEVAAERLQGASVEARDAEAALAQAEADKTAASAPPPPPPAPEPVEAPVATEAPEPAPDPAPDDEAEAA